MNYDFKMINNQHITSFALVALIIESASVWPVVHGIDIHKVI